MSVPIALPVREEWFEALEVEPGIHVITEPATHALILSNTWLVHGRDQDLLVDTGNGIAPLRPFVDALREDPEKPLVAFATHQHQDHAGGLWEFDERVAHASDAGEIEHPTPLIRGSDVWPAVADAMAWEGFPVTDVLMTARPSPDWDPDAFASRGATPTRLVTEGDVMDLGDRAFRVLSLPGHTPGSVGLWDDTDGTLFCGDVVYAEDPLIDQAPTSDVDDYIATMHRLRDLPVRIAHAGHDRSMDRPTMLRRCTAYIERRSGGPSG
jgi:glyoxylase-like metal-dependent hydrolase (beta-lactamase superfamily II)